MTSAVQEFIREYSKEVEAGNAAIFAGAGLSMPAGFVDWKGLLKPLVADLGLDVEREDDLVAMAQFHVNENGQNRNRLNQILVDEFTQQVQITANHRILARLPITTYWTTNYDKLIETALESADKIPDVKYTTAQLAVTRPRRDAVVYKMHGDVDHADNAVLIKDDYEAYHVKMEPYITALSGDLVSKTFLFIGFSFSDPNLDYVLSRIRIAYTQNQRRHYCFLRAVQGKPDEDPSDFTYREVKQALLINDLKRFNIRAVLVSEYDEITQILQAIELKHKQRSVFVSGSAHEYGLFAKETAESFIHGLAEALIKGKCRVISGFGLGVGSAIISGALETIYSNKRRYSDAQLLLRPFPQSESGLLPLAELWERYRQDMIAYAGVAIFVFGNKMENGVVVEASGMEREFRIAVEQGCKVLPVGNTGFVAEKLHHAVINDFGRFYPEYGETFKLDFERLGDKMSSLKETIEVLLRLIAQIVAG